MRKLFLKRGVWFLALFSFVIHLFRLNEPPNLVLDEEIYLGGFQLTTNHHPPLGYWLFGLSQRVFGSGPVGGRFLSVLAGTLLLPLIYFFCQSLWSNRKVALTAALFLSLETLTFVHSRLATIDILLTLFVLASFYFLLVSLHSQKQTFNGSVFGVGLFLGLALAIKWSAVFSWVVILLIVAVARRKWVWFVFALPILVYSAVFLLGGFDLNEVFTWHQETVFFHVQTEEGFNQELSSPFWSWPLLFSPATYFRIEKFTPGDHFTQVINAFGNMPLFWAFFPAFGFLGWEAFKFWQQGKRQSAVSHLLLIFFFFFHWLPWAIFPRLTFGYYFLPAIPFGCAAVAYGCQKAWKNPRLRSLVVGYLALVIGFFFLLYPTYAAVPIPEKVFDLVNRLGRF